MGVFILSCINEYCTILFSILFLYIKLFMAYKIYIKNQLKDKVTYYIGKEF